MGQLRYNLLVLGTTVHTLLLASLSTPLESAGECDWTRKVDLYVQDFIRKSRWALDWGCQKLKSESASQADWPKGRWPEGPK